MDTIFDLSHMGRRIVGNPASVAKSLSLVCRDWYAAAHRLMYHSISLIHEFNVPKREMERNWEKITSRLALPPHASVFGAWSALSAGQFVRRLDIVALEMSLEIQNGILAILKLCPNLYSITIQGLSFSSMDDRLTEESNLAIQFESALTTAAASLNFLSLTLPLDPAAVPLILNGVSKATQLRYLALRFDTFWDPQLPYEQSTVKPAVMPHLTYLTFDSVFGGNYRVFTDLEQIDTPSLKTVSVSGLGPMVGFRDFVHKNAGTITSTMINYMGMLGFPSLPSMRALTSLVVPYNWASDILLGVYPSTRYIGLTGVISCHVSQNERRLDMLMLSTSMEILCDRSRLPNLQVVQLLDVTNRDLHWTVWCTEDTFLWEYWVESCGEIGVIVLDGDGDLLETSLLALYPELELDPDHGTDSDDEGGYMADVEDLDALDVAMMGTEALDFHGEQARREFDPADVV